MQNIVVNIIKYVKFILCKWCYCINTSHMNICWNMDRRCERLINAIKILSWSPVINSYIYQLNSATMHAHSDITWCYWQITWDTRHHFIWTFLKLTAMAQACNAACNAALEDPESFGTSRFSRSVSLTVSPTSMFNNDKRGMYCG